MSLLIYPLDENTHTHTVTIMILLLGRVVIYVEFDSERRYTNGVRYN